MNDRVFWKRVRELESSYTRHQLAVMLAEKEAGKVAYLAWGESTEKIESAPTQTPIEKLNIPHCFSLRRAGILTIEQLEDLIADPYGKHRLLAIRNVGPRTAEKILNALQVFRQEPTTHDE